MNFEIVTTSAGRFVKISDPPQLMSRDDLWQWMIDARDDNPNLYAHLVHAYIVLTTPPKR